MRSPSDDAPRLRATGVTKAFGRLVVLDGVGLEASAGEVLLLTGSNGSGKTTLLRCIAGLARHGGEILVDGRRVTGAAGRAALGYLPQAPGLPPWATGAEILRLFARLRGADPAGLDLPAGFLPALGRPVGQLSGGQQQRVAVAVALLGDPGLLLLDEPTANLDAEGHEALLALIDARRRHGATVVVAAPAPDALGGLADRTIRLVEGRASGSRGRPARPAPDDLACGAVAG